MVSSPQIQMYLTLLKPLKFRKLRLAEPVTCMTDTQKQIVRRHLEAGILEPRIRSFPRQHSS
jgi:hypothetical protein